MGVRANADNAADATRARELGAEGIGLCRTEHMFMASDRLPAVREMILAENAEQRATALEKICLLYTSPSPRDRTRSRMPSSA